MIISDFSDSKNILTEHSPRAWRESRNVIHIFWSIYPSDIYVIVNLKSAYSIMQFMYKQDYLHIISHLEGYHVSNGQNIYIAICQALRGRTWFTAESLKWHHTQPGTHNQWMS